MLTLRVAIRRSSTIGVPVSEQERAVSGEQADRGPWVRPEMHASRAGYAAGRNQAVINYTMATGAGPRQTQRNYRRQGE
jgi:hypothetical protein